MAVADWVSTTGKNLTTVYITHGHGDHWFGLGAVRGALPRRAGRRDASSRRGYAQVVHARGDRDILAAPIPGQILRTTRSPIRWMVRSSSSRAIGSFPSELVPSLHRVTGQPSPSPGTCRTWTGVVGVRMTCTSHWRNRADGPRARRTDHPADRRPGCPQGSGPGIGAARMSLSPRAWTTCAYPRRLLASRRPARRGSARGPLRARTSGHRAVGDVHRGEVLSGGRHPVSHGHALLDRHEGSTRTASCWPEIRVAEIGLQVERLWPGGRSLVAIAMIGVT